MRQVIKFSGFILIIIGFIGLIITEFVFGEGRAGSPNFTLIFGAIDAVGLATLAFAHWGIKKTYKT